MEEGEAQLWEQWATQRDRRARDALILMHAPWARQVAREIFFRVRSKTIEWGDFVQNATVGLIEATDRFDPTRGIGFHTFAKHRIRGAVFDGLRRLWNMEYSSSATQVDRSESLNDEEADPLDAFVTWTVGMGIGWLLDGVSLHDPASLPQTPYAELERDQLREILGHAVDLLPERERLVLTLHYFQYTPFSDIAVLLKVTKGRVSQLHKQGIARLRDCLRVYANST